MAKYNGVQIKSVKSFRGHEGELLSQGTLYINDKKVGFYSDGDWGREPYYDWDDMEIGRQLENSRDLNRDVMEFFILYDLEKSFKKGLRKKHDFVASLYKEYPSPIEGNPNWKMPTSTYTGVLRLHKEQIESIAESRNEKVDWYTSLDDFVVNK